MIRYRSKRPDDAPLRERMVDLAHERRRFGYRRLHVILKSEGLVVNRKKTQRIYREEGLKVRRRGARRRAIGTRALIPVANRPNARWSLDFVYDQFVCRRRFRILNVVNDVTKECLGAIPDVSVTCWVTIRWMSCQSRSKKGQFTGGIVPSFRVLAPPWRTCSPFRAFPIYSDA